MKGKVITVILIIQALMVNAQPLLLLDRFNGNKVINDSVITVFSSDMNIVDLTQYFTMKNNTGKPLAVFLRKTVNFMADSTTDYYCFGIRCWPGDDSTNVADTIPAGGEDYTFASHVVHKRRFDFPQPLLPPGLTSITYTVYDETTFPEPVEASVTVRYHLSGLGIEEEQEGRQQPGPKENVAVYPNPATDRLNILWTDNSEDKVTLMIFNNLGVMVMKSPVSFKDDLLSIPVSHLIPGLYFGKLISSGGSPSTFRFQVAY